MEPIRQFSVPVVVHTPDMEDCRILASMTLGRPSHLPSRIVDFGDLNIFLQNTITVAKPRVWVLLTILWCRAGSKIVEKSVQELRLVTRLVVADHDQVAAVLEEYLGIFLHAVDRLKTFEFDGVVGQHLLVKLPWGCDRAIETCERVIRKSFHIQTAVCKVLRRCVDHVVR